MSDFDYSSQEPGIILKDVPIPKQRGRGKGFWGAKAREMEVGDCFRCADYGEAQALSNCIRDAGRQPLMRTIAGSVFVWRIR